MTAPETAPTPATDPVADAGTDREIKPYDFRRPRRVSKDRLRALEAMYERMVRSLEGWCVGRARGGVEMRLKSVEQLSFGEYQLSLPSPCAAYIFDIEDSAGQQGVMNVGMEFSYFVVDRLLGGAAGAFTMLDRPLTMIERSAVQMVVERSLGLMQEIWQDHVELKTSVTAVESVPEIIQAANPDDPMLVVMIDCKAENETSQLSICVPLAVLDKFFTSGDQRRGQSQLSGRESELAREVAEQGLRASAVLVQVRLPTVNLPLALIEGAQEGDEIPLNIPVDDHWEVLIEGQHRYSGVPGNTNGNYAIELMESTRPRGDLKNTP